MPLKKLIDHVEMAIYVTGFRGLSLLRPIGDLVRTANRWAERIDGEPGKGSVEESVGLAKRAAGRASRLVPGAACLHRALAARVWLARRGIEAEIVVGFRKEGALEGHAWLEVASPTGPIEVFDEPSYRESFRESGLIGSSESERREIRSERP